MTLRQRALEALGLALGVLTTILGLNEATADVWNRLGSNYWLAYSATISGASIIVITIILSRLRARHYLVK